MTQEVLKLALEFLEDNQDLIEVYERPEYLAMYKAVIDKCKEALAQPEPCDMGDICIGCSPRNADGSCPSSQRTWIELEGEEIRNSWEEATKPDRSTMTMVTSFARAIEAKLKEKNT